jgi:CHRD domain
MLHGFRTIAASIAIIPAISCSGDASSPTDATVQLAIVAGADHGGRPFSTLMTQEVTTTPVWAGDPDGSGVASITVNPGQGEICWTLSVAGIALPASSAHIHQAAPGIRGAIVVALSPPDATGTATGCVSGVNADLLRSIRTSPEGFYVNVHTSQFPAGAVRGQLAE